MSQTKNQHNQPSRKQGWYVSTPIYYVNASPHIGHAYTTIAADILARHQRQLGKDVFFLTGSDEHGEPVALAAAEQGISPKQLADQNVQHFQDLLPQVNASNSFFIRTSDPRHTQAVQEILKDLYQAGYIYKGAYQGLYCNRCADFKTSQEIGQDNTCPIHGIGLVAEEEENWFFRLSAFQTQLEELFENHPNFIQPAERYNEALAFLRRGLQDVSCSRSGISWGVPVPWDPDQVFYVWFDALLNYITALRFAQPGQDLTSRYWPADVQIIGKDILKFHAIYWPAILLAAGLDLPRKLLVHGFLNKDGEKISKSRGNVIDPLALIESYGSDALRFYLFREVPFGADGTVSNQGFHTRYNTELANDFGNLVNRSLAMLQKWSGGKVPEVALDPDLAADFISLPDEVAELLGESQITAALAAAWARVRRLNQYVEETAPWELAKDPEQSQRLQQVLSSLISGLQVLAVVLHAFVPDSCDKLLSALGSPGYNWSDAAWPQTGSGRQLGELEPLFPKL